MPIDVTCPGCKTRFKVSDQFAGKKGPCPKCKVVIEVPAATEQVVIHAPDQFGPKDAQGRAVLKPLTREETKMSVPIVVAVIGTIVTVLAVALWARFKYAKPDELPPLLLMLGALALAPPVVWSGYTFMRDAELEPYRGFSLALRVFGCAVVYAALWGAHMLVKSYFFENAALKSYDLLYCIPPLVIVGGFASFVALDLPFGIAMLHYSFYGLVTVLLRLMLRMTPF